MKKKQITIILALFLGSFGVHHFYLGNRKKGFTYLYFFWTLIPFILSIIDFFKLVALSEIHFDCLYNNQNKCSICHNIIKEKNVINNICKKCSSKVKSEKYNMITREKTVIPPKVVTPISEVNKIYYLKGAKIFEKIEELDKLKNLTLNAKIKIEYEENSSLLKGYELIVYNIDQTFDKDYSLKSYCYEHKSISFFKFSKIKEIIDMDTGEIFQDAIKYFTSQDFESNTEKILKCLSEFAHELNIFIYISKINTDLNKIKRNIIKDYIIRNSTEELDTILLSNEISIYQCSTNEFKESIEIYSRRKKKEKIKLLDNLIKIIESERDKNEMQLGALKLIENKFNG